jgi:hypothetical protein
LILQSGLFTGPLAMPPFFQSLAQFNEALTLRRFPLQSVRHLTLREFPLGA